MKKLLLTVLLLSMVFILAACGGDDQVEQAAPTGETKEILLVATNWDFDQAEYVVNAGDNVIMTLENSQGVHGIKIRGLDVTLEPNASTQEFFAGVPGEYEIYCHIQCGVGHNDMKAKFIVQ